VTGQVIRGAGGWFDQFTEYLAAHPEVVGNEQWCRRHWAPCPALGANGILASMMLMQIFVDDIMPPGLTSVDDQNAALAEASPVCCRLGDERMYDVWGKCPPARSADA
jgi:hypothetical protein